MKASNKEQRPAGERPDAGGSRDEGKREPCAHVPREGTLVASGSIRSCWIVPASSSRGTVTGSTCVPSEPSSEIAACTAAATSGSARSSSSSTTPTRSPLMPSSSPVCVPAIASSRRAQSSALRAIGPTVSNVHETGKTPSLETSPIVGRSPVTPQKHAGMRIEPPVSVPSVAAARSAAAAAPEPPLEPPQTRSSDHGLRAGPKCGLVVRAP